jgi:spermidine/putrescine-binding protein
MVKRGERVIAVGADSAYVGEARKNGSPFSIIYPQDGAFVIPSPSSVVKGSPNPNAARAFAVFMLSRPVQELFPHEYLYSARTDVAGPEGNRRSANQDSPDRLTPSRPRRRAAGAALPGAAVAAAPLSAPGARDVTSQDRSFVSAALASFHSASISASVDSAGDLLRAAGALDERKRRLISG